MNYKYLIGFFLASSIASAAEQVPTIPAQFVGEWNAKLADCGSSKNDSDLRITPQSITYYESTGPVKAVVSNGKDEVATIVQLSGEGETWLATDDFKLSADGTKLESGAQAGDSLTRYRCPKHRK
jgi:hypothetical protein